MPLRRMKRRPTSLCERRSSSFAKPGRWHVDVFVQGMDRNRPIAFDLDVAEATVPGSRRSSGSPGRSCRSDCLRSMNSAYEVVGLHLSDFSRTRSSCTIGRASGTAVYRPVGSTMNTTRCGILGHHLR